MELSKRDKKLLELAQSGGTDKELALFEQMNELEDKFDSTVEEIKKSVPDLNKVLATVKGNAGDAGKDGLNGNDGFDGEQGPPGPAGRDGKNGKDGRDGRDGTNGRDGKDGRDGVDGVQGENGQDGSPDTPDEIINKINSSKLLISKERIDGLLDALGQMISQSVPITTNFFNGLRAKNLTIVGATVVQRGDTVFATVSGTGGGQVNSIVAGVGISVDSTDPANPVVTNTGSSPNFADNEVVSGSGTTFTLAHSPTAGTQHIYGAGTRLTPGAGNDYTISGATITILNGTYLAGEILSDYRY